MRLVPSPFVSVLKLAASPAGRKVVRQAVRIARTDEGRKLLAQARKVATSPEGRKLIDQVKTVAGKPAGATTTAGARSRLAIIHDRFRRDKP